MRVTLYTAEPFGPQLSAGKVGRVSDQPEQPRQRVRVRAWHIVLLIAAVITTILLANWQWQRYQSGSGTFQNLGYALQWPFFGAFFVYAYRTGIKMENEKIDAINAGEVMEDMYEADLAKYGAGSSAAGPKTIDASFLPERPQLDVEEYNELLTPRRGHGGHGGQKPRKDNQ